MKQICKSLIYLILLNVSRVYPQIGSGQGIYTSQYVRVKRQAGYVYNRPNVSFNLPSGPSISTQAPNVDRAQPQQNYVYQPPADNGRNINDRPSTGASTTSNLSANNVAAGGYNYGLMQSNAGIAGSQATDITSSNGYGGGNVPKSGVSDYVYNAPPAGTGSFNVESSSTKGPQYLPPTNSGMLSVSEIASAKSSGNVNLSETSANISPPSDSYLPPIAGSSRSPEVGISRDNNPSGKLDSNYLAPVSNPTPISPVTSIDQLSVRTSKPTSGYLSPTRIDPLPAVMSTPAPTYLPPTF